MPITANTLYRDSFNFFKNQLLSTLTLAVLAALVTTLLGHLFIPDSEQMKLLTEAEFTFATSGKAGIQELVSQMTPEQQSMIMRAGIGTIFSSMIGSVLLVGGVLTLVAAVSAGNRISSLQAIGLSASQLPKLFLLLLICTLLIQLGLMLMLVPGIILSIALALSPVIMTAERRGIFASMKISWKLAFANIRLLVPAILLWLTARLLLVFIIDRLTFIHSEMAGIILGVFNNLISAILLIYLFRLYMLIASPQPKSI
ncbi:UPF0259 family protein [Photorhabdus luminescens]|uniref:YciC family protein n=1 Tax=Photorhabdus akhurstii TaxID=171438 RepID=UPI00052DFB07|nr:YciC family protein [Photorhabdus akhurstii]KGM29653.1 hypothetical protein KS18_01920 [Photorhabdus luminescens]MBS9427351.1 UPF0259 family protein [Photorhabdus akhurstii]PQQ32550.1 UPF0259 family protein [Photorhabdus luminescens]